MENVVVTVCSMNEERGVVVFSFRSGRRCLGEQEVICTGDLRKDVGNAARWFLGGNYGLTGKLRQRNGGYTSLPHPALAAYGITRETVPIGAVSVEAPIFDVIPA